MAGVRGCLRGGTLNTHQQTVVKETGGTPNLKRTYVQSWDKLSFRNILDRNVQGGTVALPGTERRECVCAHPAVSMNLE